MPTSPLQLAKAILDHLCVELQQPFRSCPNHHRNALLEAQTAIEALVERREAGEELCALAREISAVADNLARCNIARWSFVRQLYRSARPSAGLSDREVFPEHEKRPRRKNQQGRRESSLARR